MGIEPTQDALQRPANGFEDPCGRVEYGTGPGGPLTQRSINRLGVRQIVFQRTHLYYERHAGPTSVPPRRACRWSRWLRSGQRLRLTDRTAVLKKIEVNERQRGMGRMAQPPEPGAAVRVARYVPGQQSCSGRSNRSGTCFPRFPLSSIVLAPSQKVTAESVVTRPFRLGSETSKRQ
jgi:hypothetical protein